MTRQHVQLPFGFNVLLIAFGAIVLGAHTATGYVSVKPDTVVQRLTHTLTKRVEGRIVTLPGGTRVIRVPKLRVYTDHVVVKVPAQTLPITRVAEGLRALPKVPVTITIHVPVGGGSSVSTVTETLPPSTTTVTLPPVTITVPTTVTIPLTDPTTSDQGGTP